MDPTSPWWTVACMESAAKMAACILFEVYELCGMWVMSQEVIVIALRLYLKSVLRNEGAIVAGNGSECGDILDAIKRSCFRYLPAYRSALWMKYSISPGCANRGTDYRFYNPCTTRFINADDVIVLLR